MKDPTKLKELVIQRVDLAEVMKHYGVKFAYNPEHADEAQFSCPFHGKDNKPSARFYRATQSCYCWVCRKKWDVVSFIREKENLGFNAAVWHLIDWFHVDVSIVSDDPEFLFPKKEPVPEEIVRTIMLRNKINDLRGKLPFDKFNAVCSVYLMIMYEMSKGIKVISKIDKLESKLAAMEI
jgi:CHC2 zinc finger